MKNFIDKLQAEAGLTRNQARMTVGVFRNYLVETNEDPDLTEMLKSKTNCMKGKVKSKYNDWAGRVENKTKKP